MAIGMINILVLCTGNSCRSQIAHGYLNHYFNGKANVYSAGIETHGVNPRAIMIMKEDGIDISNHTSNHIDEYKEVEFDYIITVCDHALERCPVFPSNAIKYHYNFPDPAKAIGDEETILSQFREVRNQIKSYCEDLSTQGLRTP